MFYPIQPAQFLLRGPQQWVLRDPIKSAERSTIGPRPTVCRPLAYGVIG